MVVSQSSQSFDSDLKFYAYCIHEAGHAVTAYSLGFPVAWVSIDSGFIKSDPLAIENNIGPDAAVAMVRGMQVIGHILDRGYCVSAEERSAIRNYCIETAAGPVAEERINPRFPPEACAGDFGQICAVIARVEKDNFKRGRKFADAVKGAQDFVSDNWPRIYSFAVELYNQKTLHADDIGRILSEAPSSAPQPPFQNRVKWRPSWRAPTGATLASE